jgi:hypothetical protein
MNKLIALQVALDQLAHENRENQAMVATLIEARTAAYELNVLKGRIETVLRGV